jgi:uncharacterized membrane protein
VTVKVPVPPDHETLTESDVVGPTGSAANDPSETLDGSGFAVTVVGVEVVVTGVEALSVTFSSNE